MQKMHNVIWRHFSETDRQGCFRGFLAVYAFLVVSALAPFGVHAQASAPAPVRLKITAASNLKFVLADLSTQYRQQTGVQVDVNLGASGNLARQILQGLPVEQFISADEAWVAELAKAGRTMDAGQRYATGRLALIVPKNSALPLGQGLAAVVRAMKPGDKFAIANPALAPYGVAAEEALLRAGVGPLPAARKVLGDNIGQATQFVATGAAQAGITALALTHAPEISDNLQILPLPADLHAPLHQRMVLLKGASVAATDWHRFLLSPAAQVVWVRHGYALPQ
jgi:molybdate transport system substrate-binding protein